VVTHDKGGVFFVPWRGGDLKNGSSLAALTPCGNTGASGHPTERTIISFKKAKSV